MRNARLLAALETLAVHRHSGLEASPQVGELLIWIFVDIFRSRDLSGWAKALWFLFVLFIPLIGVLVYLIACGGSMHERAAQNAQQQDAEFREYAQEAAASSPASTADQLAKLADLRDRGVISAQPPGAFQQPGAPVSQVMDLPPPLRGRLG